MEDYLSEREQIARIREWWREYGWYLLAGLVLGAIIIFGLRWYRTHETEAAGQAGVLYTQVRTDLDNSQLDSATSLVTKLRDQYSGSPYADQAGLMLAHTYLASKKPKLAAKELRYVMTHTGDHELGVIARLRLTRVLIDEKQYQDALNLLAVDKPGQFAAEISALRGDAYMAMGDSNAARTAYADALLAPGAEWLNQNYLKMKLSALPAAHDKAGKDAGA